MNKQQEKLLVAALAGMVIAGVAAFAVQPAIAAGYAVDQLAKVSNVARWDTLNVRRWPASYSQKVGEFTPGTHVWVERCNIIDGTSDWCLVENGQARGWVNSRYLAPATDTDI
jgi:uncharacterized protein YraI